MLIVKRATYSWFDRALLSYDAAPYNGAVAHAKGETRTEVVPTGPFGPQIPHLMTLFNNASQLLSTGQSPGIAAPQPFPGSTVAETPQSLQQNQQAILDFTGSQVPVVGSAVNTAANAANTSFANPTLNVGAGVQPALEQGLLALISGQNPSLAFGQSVAPAAGQALTSALSASPGGINTQGAPSTPIGGIDVSGQLQQSLQGGALNPMLDQVIEAATRSANRQFTDTTLPAIRQEAVQAGQVGGSREGVAQGIAASRHDENVSDVITQIMANAFNQSAAERGQALGLTTNLASMNPQLALETARLNEAQRQGTANTAINASDLILRQLLGGSQVASGNVGAGTQQAGNLLSTGVAQGQNQLFNALGLIPSLQTAGLTQLGAGNQVGLQQLGLDQAVVDDQVSRFFFEQFAPYAALAQFQNFITGNFGSSV